MLSKMTVKTSNFFSIKSNELKQRISMKLKNNNGMEMLQMILIIGIAVMIGGAVYALMKGTLGSESDSTSLLGKIKDRLTNLMNF